MIRYTNKRFTEAVSLLKSRVLERRKQIEIGEATKPLLCAYREEWEGMRMFYDGQGDRLSFSWTLAREAYIEERFLRRRLIKEGLKVEDYLSLWTVEEWEE